MATLGCVFVQIKEDDKGLVSRCSHASRRVDSFWKLRLNSRPLRTTRSLSLHG